MKTKLFPSLILFSCYIGTAQNLKIIYTVSENKSYFENKKDSIPDSFYPEMNQTMAYFEQIDYTLIIDGQKSAFWMNKSMETDSNPKLSIARIIAGFGSGSYFSDAESHVNLQQTSAYGDQFLISMPYDEPKWDLTSETKTILNFKTYKAQTTESVTNKSGTQEIVVTAWFAPEINKPFGPGEYGNLPGLIMELQRAGKIYRIKSIEKTQQAVDKPTKGKEITKEEFNEIGRKMNTRR